MNLNDWVWEIIFDFWSEEYLGGEGWTNIPKLQSGIQQTFILWQIYERTNVFFEWVWSWLSVKKSNEVMSVQLRLEVFKKQWRIS